MIDIEAMDNIETENTEISNESDIKVNNDDSNADSVKSLKEEIARLRGELEESKLANERISSDISEFYRLFPDGKLENLPNEVREGVRSGIPLTASYALYEKRLEAERERIEAINRKNASLSSGRVGKNTQKEYFSPDEVRSMSQSEVRENYNKIIESMKKWN